MQIIAFFKTSVFLESDFNDFFSGLEQSHCPKKDVLTKFAPQIIIHNRWITTFVIVKIDCSKYTDK